MRAPTIVPGGDVLMPCPTSSRTPRRIAAGLLAVGLALFTGCAQQRFEKLFAEGLGRQALACLHPGGAFLSADGVKAEGSDTFTGVVTWKGQVLGNEYLTRVRVTLVGATARVEVLEDTAVTAAVRDSCEVPLTP